MTINTIISSLNFCISNTMRTRPQDFLCRSGLPFRRIFWTSSQKNTRRYCLTRGLVLKHLHSCEFVIYIPISSNLPTSKYNNSLDIQAQFGCPIQRLLISLEQQKPWNHMNQGQKHSILFITALLAVLQMTSQQCTPYYPRIFWNPSSEEIVNNKIDHIFMWNTNNSCAYSFIQVYVQGRVSKFRCTEKRIQTFNTDKSLQFYHYVQTCKAYVESGQEIGTFSYRLFGSKYIDGLVAEPSDLFDVQMPTSDLPLRFAVISDWGPIIEKQYKPLNDTLDYILAQRQLQIKSGKQTNQWRINGVVLNGDYAYNLQTYNCQMYLLFLNQISRITRFWPILTTVGNHQSMLPKSMYLFQNSFVIGRLSTADGNFQRVQSFRFANRTTFLFFDPFLEIYKKGAPEQYQTMKKQLQKALVKRQQVYPDQFMIMASHYPVMCSQVDPHCRDAMGNMPDLYQYLSTQFDGKGLVDLYIGSHMHQYERIWPFVDNKFVNESSPYFRGRLANFVEAVGGVNYFIIEEYYKPEYFSVYSTYNLTGMGIMTISGNSLNKRQPFQIHYKHIITPKTYEVVDEFIVTNQYKEEDKMPLLRSQ